VQKVIDDCERRDDRALAKVQALLWRFAAEAAKAEAASFAREAAASAPAGRLPPILDFLPVNDDGDRAPKLIADFSRAPGGATPPHPAGDPAPRIELPPELVARLDSAA
jgi:hypothetical protein